MRLLVTACRGGSSPSAGHPHPKGFVPHGSIVVLPDDEVPCRFWVPLDEAAQRAISRAKAAYVEHVEAARRRRSLQPLSDPERAGLLAVPPIGEAPYGAPVFDLTAVTRPRGARASDG